MLSITVHLMTLLITVKLVLNILNILVSGWTFDHSFALDALLVRNEPTKMFILRRPLEKHLKQYLLAKAFPPTHFLTDYIISLAMSMEIGTLTKKIILGVAPSSLPLEIEHYIKV